MASPGERHRADEAPADFADHSLQIRFQLDDNVDVDMIFYSAEQVSKMTGMSVDWLWRQAREGRISHHKLGGRYRWTAEDLTTLAAQSAVAPVASRDDLVPVRGG